MRDTEPPQARRHRRGARAWMLSAVNTPGHLYSGAVKFKATCRNCSKARNVHCGGCKACPGYHREGCRVVLGSAFSGLWTA